MSCADAKDRLDAYLDEELQPGERLEVEAHVRACPACAARVRAERRIREHVARGADETAPAALHAGVEAIVRGAVPAVAPVGTGVAERAADTAGVRLPRAGGRRAWVGAGLALAASVVALVGLWLVAPRPSPQQARVAGLAEDHEGHHGPRGTAFLEAVSDAGALEAWFASSHDVRVDVPVAPAGAHLVGGQLCYIEGRWVPHAVYEIGGRTVSYFLLPGVAGPAQGVDGRVGDLSYVGWETPRGTVFVMGPVPAADLARAFPRS